MVLIAIIIILFLLVHNTVKKIIYPNDNANISVSKNIDKHEQDYKKENTEGIIHFPTPDLKPKDETMNETVLNRKKF